MARAAFRASGRYAARLALLARLPSLFGLAPCGVYPASVVTAGAVRSYRTFSPLPWFPGAVCFLWHWPSAGLDARIPDVIRHTTLRSSDFPLPVRKRSGSDRPVLLPECSLQGAGIRFQVSRPGLGFLRMALWMVFHRARVSLMRRLSALRSRKSS